MAVSTSLNLPRRVIATQANKKMGKKICNPLLPELTGGRSHNKSVMEGRGYLDDTQGDMRRHKSHVLHGSSMQVAKRLNRLILRELYKSPSPSKIANSFLYCIAI